MNDLRSGLVFSLTFHMIVIAVAYAGLPSLRRDFRDIREAIPVEFVSIDDVNRVTEPVVQPVVQEVSEPPPATRQAPPQQTQSAEAVPLPDATPARETAATEPPRPERSIPQDISVRNKPRPPSRLDTGRLAALIDRSVEANRQPAQETPPPETLDEQKLEETVQQLQMTAIEARVATATLIAAIKRKVEACWNVPAGAKDADDLLVRLRIRLRPDGSLSRPPEFIDSGRMTDPYYRTAAESAARAVRQCAPYDLPRDQYDLWRELNFIFDPKDMLDG